MFTPLQVWSRPLGLAGVWGAMVEDWLEELLPENADSICRDRVHLLVGGWVGGNSETGCHVEFGGVQG